MNKAIFLDRDGTINVDRGYTYKIEDLKFKKNAIEGLKLMSGLDYRLIIISNQSGIGRRYFTEEKLKKFMDHMLSMLGKNKVKVDKYYFCPHKPDDKCSCRKPKTKLVKQAELDFNLNLKESFFIGDKSIDIETGKKTGCKTILVKIGHDGKYSKGRSNFFP